MSEKAEIPRKSEWKTYAVPVTDRTFGWLRVRAPTPQAAIARARRYVDGYEDDYQALDFGGREEGDVTVDIDEGAPQETPNEAGIEWEPEEDA